MTIPVKALSEIEVKSEVSENDKILILDSVSEEARLASKEELKWDKGDKWDKWDTWPQWVQWLTWPQWPKGDTGEQWPKWDTWSQWPKWDTWLTGNTWPQWPQWVKGDKGDKGASVSGVMWEQDDMVFSKDDWTYVTLEWAKEDLKWEKWDTWAKWDKWDKGDTWAKGDKWDKWDKGDKWDTWASIVSAEFSSNDIVFTKDDSNTVTLTDAKSELKWDKWDKGNTWDTWPQWVSVVDFERISWTGAAGTLDTYEFTLSDTNTFQFSVYNWANGEWSGDMLASQNLADLTNFETARNNLWVYSKSQVDTLISNFGWFTVVSTLPSTDIKKNIIYFLWPIWTWPDKYEEWIYSTENVWTKIWETTVDLSNYFNKEVNTSDDITEWSNHLFLTPQERTKLGNQSWVNTGDQSATDFDIKDLWDTTGLRDKWTNKQDAISDLATIRTWAGKGATAVQPWDLATIATSGKLEDATGDADDISEGTNHKFLTSAERTKLGNTSWTNTGDETGTTIKTKLWAASSSADGYLKKEDFAKFNWKQDAITDSDDITQWSTNLFMTAGERTKVGNLSWTNTWDETTATIKTKLGSASASADWYLTKEDFATFNGKQNAISDLATIRSNATAGAWAASTIAWYWDVVSHDASDFAASSHSHAISDVTNLQTSLDGKITNPSGWSTWNVLKKTANGTEWGTVEALPSWWSTWQALVKTSWWAWWNDSVLSWDSWTNYVIKVSSTAPASWTANNVITFVTD